MRIMAVDQRPEEFCKMHMLSCLHFHHSGLLNLCISRYRDAYAWNYFKCIYEDHSDGPFAQTIESIDGICTCEFPLFLSLASSKSPLTLFSLDCLAVSCIHDEHGVVVFADIPGW
jgi:hypothetical protein